MMCSIAETEIPSSLHTDNYCHFGCKINRSSRAPSSLNTDNQIPSYYLCQQQQQSVGSGGERLVEGQGGGCDGALWSREGVYHELKSQAFFRALT